MKIGIIGYGNVGKMIHSRLSKDSNLSFLIGSKEPGKSIKVVEESDVLFICLRSEDIADVIASVSSVLDKNKTIFSTSLKKWPLGTTAEEILIIPTIYGLMGKGIHVALRKTQLSSNAMEIINSMNNHLGQVEFSATYDELLLRCYETGIMPALIAHAAMANDCNLNEIPKPILEKIAKLCNTTIERVIAQFALVNEVAELLGGFDKVVKFVATKGGLTEKLIKQLSPSY